MGKEGSPGFNPQTNEEKRLVSQLVNEGASTEISPEEAIARTIIDAADLDDPRSQAAVEAALARLRGGG